MTTSVTHLWRLLKWGRTLARHGALRGIEEDPMTPPPVRRLARIARFGARIPPSPDYAAALVAIGLSIGASIFVVVALLTVAGLPALIPFPSGNDWLVLLLRWPILLVLSIVVLAVLYRWGPDRHPRKFRYIWPGAVLASLLWLLAGAVFSIYVENFGNYQATFGSVSAAVTRTPTARCCSSAIADHSPGTRSRKW